jgi:sigma-B regulation protein RsbU (phosphoserine phosphatase)
MNEINSFLLSVVESSADAIIGIRLDGHIFCCNPAVANIYGYSASELKGLAISKLSLPERIDEAPLILSRIFNGERVRHFQTIHRKKDGSLFPVSLSISPVLDNFEHIAGASCIIRDLSHQLSFEKNLQVLEERYQKMKSSLELAQQVQKRLLPNLNTIDSRLDVYAKTLNCEDVGGDYYDFFSPTVTNGNILGLAVGDVSGHGTAAALLMAMAKGVLQAEVEHFPFDMAAVSERMNRFFCLNTGNEGLFMTLFLALIDVRAQLLSWCSAGQGPVYIYHSAGQYFEQLESTGVPLGVVEDTSFNSKTTALRSGDILIVGTDGLWEARNSAGEMFSVERFRQMMATWYLKTAEEICTQMLMRVKQFTVQDKLEDDISLLIVKMPQQPLLASTTG